MCDNDHEMIRGLALVLYTDGDVGCNVCGHFCSQTEDPGSSSYVICDCKCHEYPDDADFIVGDYIKTIQYQKLLQGNEYNFMKRIYHDIETKMSEISRGSKMTCHLIDERDRCIFCGALKPGSIVPFLELVGPAKD